MERLDVIADDQRSRRLFWFVIATFVIAESWAAWNFRGMYQDGAYYLFRVVERDWFYLVDPARTTVQVIRQAPLVVVRQITDASLVDLARIFTASMLFTPILVTGLCWFIAPAGTKTWALFPALCLLLSFSGMTLEAVGEAAIASWYFWLLLFVFLFRTDTRKSQALFLLLSIPAFRLHEGMAILSIVMLLAIARRYRLKSDGDRIFLFLCGSMFLGVILYELRWIIYPRIEGEREVALFGLLTARFIAANGGVNVPVIMALTALLPLAATFFFYRHLKQRISIRPLVFIFVMLTILSIIAVIFLDRAWAPIAQAQARYNPVFAGAILGAVLVIGVYGNQPLEWARSETVAVVVALSIAQMASDLMLTNHWRRYVYDFQERLRTNVGLIEAASDTGDARRDRRWRLLTPGWTSPILSVIFSDNGKVRSMVNYPESEGFKPLHVRSLQHLPVIRGVSFDEYKRAMARN